MGVCSRMRNCHRVAFHGGPTRAIPMRNSTLHACPQHWHFRHSPFPLISFSIFCWPLWHFPAANSLIKPINVIREAFPRQLPLYAPHRREATRLTLFLWGLLSWVERSLGGKKSEINCNLCFISAPGAVQYVSHFSTRSCPVFPLVSAPDTVRLCFSTWGSPDSAKKDT